LCGKFHNAPVYQAIRPHAHDLKFHLFDGGSEPTDHSSYDSIVEQA
jgi:hypothetical protein